MEGGFQITIGFIMVFGVFGCLKNIIYGETAIAFAITTFALDKLNIMHQVYSLLLGILVAGIFYMAISRVKILRYILSTVISVGIAYLVWYEAHAKLDFTWSLFGTALTFLVVQGMHVAGYKHIKETLVEKTEMKSNDN